MNFECIAWACDQDGHLSATEKLLLMSLASMACVEKDECSPSHAYLQKKTKLSRDAIIRNCKSLDSKGFISIRNSFDESGGQRENIYRVNRNGRGGVK